MLCVTGISISLFIAALLLSKQNKVFSDKYLIARMLLNTLHVSLQFSYLSGNMLQ